MTAYDFFSHYWWLIFVLFWPIMGLIGSFTHYRHRTETLKLLKSYADQGKDPPAVLLDAIKSDEQRAYDCDDRYYRRGYRRYRGGWWWQTVVFASMAAGFGYWAFYDHGPEVFRALSIGFGVAAVALFFLGAIRAVTAPRYSDLDRRDDLK